MKFWKFRFEKNSFIVIFLLLTVSTLVLQLLASGLTLGCGTSPYNDFKHAHCELATGHRDRVRIYGREWFSLPTGLIEAAAVKALPIYSDQLVWINGPEIKPIRGLFFGGFIAIHTYYDGNIFAVMSSKLIFYSLHAAYLLTLSALLAHMWSTNNRIARLSVIFILLIVYRYVEIAILPIMLLTNK